MQLTILRTGGAGLLAEVEIDFGLLTLQAAIRTRDPRCVGEYVRERIDRLDLSFHPPGPHVGPGAAGDVRPGILPQ